MPGHMLSHAGDMAGVDGSGAASPMLAPPAKSGSGGAASPGQGVPPDVLAQMQREGATPPGQVPPASPGPQGPSWQDLSAQGGQG